MKYDAEKLSGAFKEKKRKTKGFGYESMSRGTRLSVATVHRIVNFGVGKEQNVDAVAKNLGFAGSEDVMLRESATA